jgi:hypothetical protein
LPLNNDSGIYVIAAILYWLRNKCLPLYMDEARARADLLDVLEPSRRSIQIPLPTAVQVGSLRDQDHERPDENMANGEHLPSRRVRVSPPTSEHDATNMPTENPVSPGKMANNVVDIDDTCCTNLQLIEVEWERATGIAPRAYSLHEVRVHEENICKLQTTVTDLEARGSALSKEHDDLRSSLANAEQELSKSEQLEAQLDQILPPSFKAFNNQGPPDRRDNLSSSALGQEFIHCIDKQVHLLNKAQKKVTEKRKERDDILAEIDIHERKAKTITVELQPARRLLQKESLAVGYAKTRQATIDNMQHLQQIRREMVDLANTSE